jgi:hypothetical protein
MQNDSLTGLPDRALFRDRLEQAISTWTDSSTSWIISAMLSATICCAGSRSDFRIACGAQTRVARRSFPQKPNAGKEHDKINRTNLNDAVNRPCSPSATYRI